jgi:hypothetical protein
MLPHPSYSSAIPDDSTLPHRLRYTFTHIRDLLPYSPYSSHLFSLFPQPLSLLPLLAPSFYLPKYLSLSKQLLSPQFWLLIGNIIRVFLIFYVNNCFDIEVVNLLMLIQEGAETLQPS